MQEMTRHAVDQAKSRAMTRLREIVKGLESLAVRKMALRMPEESCILRAMRKAKAIKVPTTGTFDFETLIKSKTGKYVDKTALLCQAAAPSR